MSTFLRWSLESLPAIVTLVVAIAAMALAIAAWRARSRGRRDAFAHTAAEAAILVSFGVIALLTLRGSLGAPPADVNLLPFRDELLALRGQIDPTFAAALLLANLAMFVPLGAALAARFPGASALALAGVALLVSALVEGAQAVLSIGRQADVTDLLVNTLGALLGVALWRSFTSPDRQIDRR